MRFLKGNERRQAVLRGLLTTRDQIVGLQGGAGTGKTTALEIVKEIAEENGFEVRGLAPTSRARNELAARGIQSATLQKHLLTSAKRRANSSSALIFRRRVEPFIDKPDASVPKEYPG